MNTSLPAVPLLVSVDGCANHLPNPRIDMLTLDTTDSGLLRVNCVFGVATPNADLTNMMGAPCRPAGHNLITHVLIPQGSDPHTHFIGFIPHLVTTQFGHANRTPSRDGE